MQYEIDVPNKLSEITLEQYQAFSRIVAENDSEEFISQKMVSIFCKIKLSQVLFMRVQDVTGIVSMFTDMLQGEKKLQTTFKLNDTEFGFIPNLEEMSFGEYIDLDTNLGDWQTMHKAMAVLYRPITKKVKGKYEIEQYYGTANYSEVMKYAPLDVVMGAMVFFYRLNNELLKATLNYLEAELLEMDTQQKNNSANNGDGITQSMRSLKETCEDLTRSQPYQFFNV